MMRKAQSTEQTGGENVREKGRSGKKRYFRAAFLLYLILLLLAAAGTFAWFLFNDEVEVTNDRSGNVKIIVNSGDLEVSLDYDPETGEGNWFPKVLQGTGLTREAETDTVNQYYIDVTGNGESFLYPKYLTNGETAADQPDAANPDSLIDIGEHLSDYMAEIPVYFRTTTTMDVYLAGNTAVEGLETNLVSDSQENYERKSLYGDLSTDAVVGAARMAFLEDDGESLTMKNLLIPQDRLELYYSNNIARLNQNTAKRESETGHDYSYQYLYKTVENGAPVLNTYYYTKEDYASGAVSADLSQLARADGSAINQSVPLLRFEANGTAQIKKLIVRVWFEGTDREADKALNGGMIKYDLHFVGISKNDQPLTLVSGDEIPAEGTYDPAEDSLTVYYNTAKNQLCCYSSAENYNSSAEAALGTDCSLLYSLNGIQWAAYSPSSVHPEVRRSAQDKTIYLRLAESTELKPGNVIALTIPGTSGH